MEQSPTGTYLNRSVKGFEPTYFSWEKVMLTSKEKSILRAARQGGYIVKKYFRKKINFFLKTSASNLYSKADIESEKCIVRILRREYPDYNILAEESGFHDKGSSFTFIIDPLDGTHNFYLRIPYFSVAVAFVYQKKVVFSVIYQPILDDMYFAKDGYGAYCNKIKMRVNTKSALASSKIAYSCGYVHKHSELEQLYRAFDRKGVSRFLLSWCPTLDFCALASGRIDGMVNNGNEIYDHIAGKLMVREAGGVIADFQGHPTSNDRSSYFLAASNSRFLKNIIPIVKRVL